MKVESACPKGMCVVIAFPKGNVRVVCIPEGNMRDFRDRECWVRFPPRVALICICQGQFVKCVNLQNQNLILQIQK